MFQSAGALMFFLLFQSFFIYIYIDAAAQCRPSAPGYISVWLIYYLASVKVNSNKP